MSTPYVSVVLTIFNGQQFIKAAVNSILAQTFEDFELIIVDDASQDQTPAILKSFSDHRITVITNDVNMGPFGAANRGLAIARGDLIARHDADDISLPARFEKQIEILETHPKMSLLGTSYHMIDEQGRILETSIQPTSNTELQQLLEKKNAYCHGSIMVRKSALDEVGGYRDYFSASQDYDLFLRLAEVGEIGNVAEPLYLFRFHGKSISRKKRSYQLACRYFANDLALRRRSNQPEIPVPADIVAAYPPKPTDLFGDARGTSYLFFASGNRPEAAAALRRAVEISQEANLNDFNWEKWVLDRAVVLASLRGEVSTAADFISWAAKTLFHEGSNEFRVRVLQRFYMQQAFLAYEEGNPSRVVANGLAAYRININSIRNRGLGVIILKSILGLAKG